MKLQKQLSKKRGDNLYYKHVIVIPEEIIKESGFKGGDELNIEVKKGEIKLKVMK